MRIVEQSATLLEMTPDPIMLLERCGRVCYKSEEKLSCDCMPRVPCVTCRGRAEKFIQMIIKRGHTSVLEHASATFLLVTDRGVTHELVRHRVGISYSQESTRYCNYGTKGGEITVVRPPGILLPAGSWERAMKTAEASYLELIAAGNSPQIARSVLPTCLKTEIATTANFREWRTIFAQRLSPAAHPQMRELMGLVLNCLQSSIARAAFQDVVSA